MPKNVDDVTATLLTFAQPPAASKEQVAQDCVEGGLTSIGIAGPYNDTDRIDFGAIGKDSCVAFGHFIELCVHSKGFSVFGVAGGFVQLHDQKIVMLLGDLVKAISNMMH